MNELLKQNFSDTRMNLTPKHADSGLLGDSCIKQTGSSHQQLELGNPSAARPLPFHLTSWEVGRRAIGLPRKLGPLCIPAERGGGAAGAGRREQKVASSARAGLGFWQLTLRAVWEVFCWFFFPSKSNGWRRSITRLLSSDLCLVLLLHLGTCDRHAVMCAQRGTGKGEPASLFDGFPAFSLLFPSVSLLSVSSPSHSSGVQMGWSTSKLDFVALLNFKKKNLTPFSVTWLQERDDYLFWMLGFMKR